MSLFFYYSYSSKLTTAEKRVIDENVIQNRLAVINFLKKVYKPKRLLSISNRVGIVILVSISKNVTDIGVPVLPPVSSTIMKHSYATLSVKNETERFFQTDEIKSNLVENRIPTLDKIVELRGGDLSPLAKGLFRIIFLWSIAQRHTEGFQPGRPGFGHPGQANPSSRGTPKLKENPVERNNPQHQNCKKYQSNSDGTFTKEQKRNLPSIEDVFIPEQNVTIRDGQARYKLKKHGYHFDIESTQNSKGEFITQRTPENIQIFKNKLRDLVLNGNRVEGTYRINKPEGFEAIHFYDPKTGNNAIFKKKTQEFVSAWKLTEKQYKDLIFNKNVGGS